MINAPPYGSGTGMILLAAASTLFILKFPLINPFSSMDIL